MLITEILEAPNKTAVFAFGRMNPPTAGHKKIGEVIKAQPGDPFIFVTHTQNAKTDPLTFSQKLTFAQKMFPMIKVGDKAVRTWVQAMQKLEQMGYTNIIYVAGSDRVNQFNELLNKYNGKEYNFNSVKVVSAGERDPDAQGLEGMSASKMRDLAARGDKSTFINAVPIDPKTAEEMYNQVRTGLKLNPVTV
jgi:nicotinamide mononucleotide adenylyltransferase|tara:strand:- start:865 stop:1440 length:576 start_codon:yes stop_codon:yes gene_type:complete